MRCHLHTKRSRRAGFVFAKAAAQPRSYKTRCTAVLKQRYIGSGAPSSRLCASSHGVCVCGWCTASGDRTTTTLTSNATAVNHVSSLRVYEACTNRTAAAQAALLLCSSCPLPWPIQLERVPPFGLAMPPGYRINPIPNGEPWCQKMITIQICDD